MWRIDFEKKLVSLTTKWHQRMPWVNFFSNYIIITYFHLLFLCIARCFQRDVENDHVTGTGESGWFLFCSFGILSWFCGEDGACWGLETVNFKCTSRTTQTNQRENKGKGFDEGRFCKNKRTTWASLPGQCTQTTTVGFWKSSQSTMLLQSTFACRGEPFTC